MQLFYCLAAIFAVVGLTAANGNVQVPIPNEIPTAPATKLNPFQHTYHGEKINDPYQWIKDEGLNSKDVGEFLRNEEIYAQQVLQKSRLLRKKIFEEISRTPAFGTVLTSWDSGTYTYVKKEYNDKPYPIYLRKRANVRVAREIPMLDVNTLGKAAGRIGSFKTAKNEEMLAFTVDSTGNERYTIYFKNLATMTMLDYTIENVNAQIEWSATGESILYTPVDAKGHAKRIMRHMVGDTRKKDVLVYGDREDITTVKFEKSSSGRYFFIYGGSAKGTSVFYMDANSDIKNTLMPIVNPLNKIIKVEHLNSQFLIASKVKPDGTQSLYRYYYVCDIGQEKDFKSWTPVLGEINSVDVNTLVFREHLVLFEQAGNIQVKIFPFTNGKLTPGIAPIPIKFPDASYSIDIPTQSVFDSHLVKFGYASLITPLTAFTYDVKSGKRGTITLNEFPGYVRGRYVTTMITAPTAPDANGSSQLIPITIAYRADLKRKDGRNPLWLTGYGSYGIAYTPSFKPEVISLLDRGFIFAIAHVRGGGELNLSWQLQGKQHRKKNSFSDFISVADKLVAEKYTSHDMMVIEGTSAGGMLIGAVLNERPDIAKVAILNVPFLDVLDTMMDPNNPTASTDNYEWGNPITSKEYYNTIKLYSPYDNIKPNKEYPNVLVLAGLNDRRVPYWDPAKWVAKLRATTNARNSNGRKDPRTIVMLADKDAGHTINSNNYKYNNKIATMLAYAIDKLQLGMNAQDPSIVMRTS